MFEELKKSRFIEQTNKEQINKKYQEHRVSDWKQSGFTATVIFIFKSTFKHTISQSMHLILFIVQVHCNYYEIHTIKTFVFNFFY